MPNAKLAKNKSRWHGKHVLPCPVVTAYGDRGVPGVIPGGATQTFDVEFVGIKK
jgi:FKBP-type peptidyl-prolyl cis-trans isomerase